MAVFAHPDDEAFSVAGTLAGYAEHGAEVTLVCATRGESGKITVPGMTVANLGQQREGELRAACVAIGILAPVFLDYHDSGRLERTRYDDPAALMNADLWEVEDRIGALMAERRPHILITFDPHGAYGHVDHLQIQRGVLGAFFTAGHLPYGGPQRLYYTGISAQSVEEMSRMDPARALTPERFGIDPATAAVRMRVGQYTERKKAALAAHGTQMGPSSPLGGVDAATRERYERELLAEEWFSIGGTRTAVFPYPLPQLLSGIDTSR